MRSIKLITLASVLLVANGVSTPPLSEMPDFSAVLAGGFAFLATGPCEGQPMPMGTSFDQARFLEGDWFEVYRDSEVWF